MSIVSITIIAAIIAIYIASTTAVWTEHMFPLRRGRMFPLRTERKHTFNKCNRSWHRDGYVLPSESQIHKSDVELHKNWEAYWSLVDVGLITPTNDPNLYYALK